QNICFTAATTLDWIPGLSSPSQLLLELRLSSLPTSPGYSITRQSDFPPLSSEPRFLSVTGVVLSATLPSEYTQSACFHCPVEGCSGRGSHYVRLHVAGSSEAATVRPSVHCHICSSPLTEDLSLRTIAHKMVVNVVPSHSLRNSLSTPSHRHQATPIIIRGELCEGVRVGGEYSVIGVPVHTLNESSSRAFVYTRLESLSLSLNAACSYSPWAFSATLAYSFAAEVVPPGAYHRLKLALLLSLASSSTPSPLHLLTVATDTTPLPALLLYGSSLASRSTQLSSTSDLWGSNRSEGGEVVMEGGALVLASGGVCVVGDTSRLKKDKLHRLQHSLEGRQVRLGVEGGARGVVTKTCPLSCSVWAFSPTQPSKALVDSVGVAVFCDPPTSGGADFLSELTTQHLLERARGSATPPPLSHSHLQLLLSVVSGVQVSLSQSCQSLLKSFYLASRRLRSSGLHSCDMPLNSLDVMSGLAEAHARLSLREEAGEEDGVMAILLYEESLTCRYGNSVLHLVPSPHFTDTNLSAYLGRQFDEKMKILHKHILQFSHSPSTLSLQPEE
ncbi:Minichromosome maintenance domain-containing protein 2, partial [Geodia barretti]